MKNKLVTFVTKNRVAVSVLAVLLFVSAVAHGWNMFHFPYYENDEGVYMSQAWSLLTRGDLAPYTYWYDHAPMGWFLIALWVKLTGWFFTFGVSVNSGRVLMLVIHVAASALIFFISKRLGGGLVSGTISVFVFSLSPAAIYFQRRVLLDNIMVFWILVSLALLLVNKLKLRHVIASSVAFGVAVLTKETAVFLVPAFLYTIFLKTHPGHRVFAYIQWLAIAGIIISSYVLYAFLNGELFASPSSEHVSLIGTLSFQMSRGGNFPFWDSRSDFAVTFKDLYGQDPFIVDASISSTIVSLILAIKVKSLRVSTVFALMFWFFLMRGKLILNFYIVPLIPLAAINIGLIFEEISRLFSGKHKVLNYPLAVAAVLVAIVFPLATSYEHFIRDETSPQIKAIDWVRANLDPADRIVIDNYAYVDLHDPSRGEVYEYADWFQKLNLDPEIRFGVYNDDWKNIDYIVLSHEMVRQSGVLPKDFPMLRSAIKYSSPVVEWRDKSRGYLDLANLISTNGDWMAVRSVMSDEQIALHQAWNYYKANFVHSYGQVIDPASGGTTSEGQSYALLRAVWMNEQSVFDGLLDWTKDHMQYRVDDELFSWLWQDELKDSATATDADQDVALALIFAHELWGDPRYLSEAKTILTDIWSNEVVYVGEHYYLLSGAGVTSNGFLINPSYVSPSNYRIFAKYDPVHDWNQLAVDSYFFLNKLTLLPGNATALPPDWVRLDPESGALSLLGERSNYSFDAFRTMCNIARDYNWNKSPEALAYLNKTKTFFEQVYSQEQNLVASYNLSGVPVVNYGSISTDIGALCNLTITNPDQAQSVYRASLKDSFTGDYWGNPENYYDQNWAWFGAAMYTGNLPDLSK